MNDCQTQNTASQTVTDDRLQNRSVPSANQPLIFFDGVCGLCNRFVDFLLRRDRKAVFRFAPLQGETARRQLPEKDTQALSTIVLLQREKTFRRSAAVVRVLWGLGGGWKFAGCCLWLVPLPLRDLGYKLVAACRYRMFGKRETCRMPLPEERDRLLP